ncbi:MAG: hypothetical protein HY544_04925 [Candidatus Diapherotrites archaeon]|uniref:VTT domain-containing protein n=1 Tax=Candidatus Iainarchaeum sp. TaxID=3101447 RepID=A0A8T3YM76_9ARCH|nr:hypothetical protein [Candidatus Diapherotrites archaeon]
MAIRMKMKYPKLAALLLTFAAAYVFASNGEFESIRNSLESTGYAGTFAAGLFFSYGFTAAPATAALLVLGRHQNILLASLIAGLGALIADTIIFRVVRHSFEDEVKSLSREKSVTYVIERIPKPALKYLVPMLAGFIIASPLPDEIGVILLAASSNVSGKAFTFFSFALNTIGIFVILYIGTAV